MLNYTGQHYGDDGLQHWREGNGNGFQPSVNDPIYTEIILDSMSEEMRFAKSVTSWKTIMLGSMNKIRAKRKDNAMLAVLSELGMEQTKQIKIEHSDMLSTLGKNRPFTLPRGMVGKFVLPEGSSRNSMRIPHGGSVWKANGVVPIGIHDAVTTEEKLFQTFTSIEEKLREQGEIIGAVTDSFYRDFQYATAGWRFDLTQLKQGYNTLQSPILSMIFKRIFNNMKAYGAREINAMTSSFLGYGTVPVSTRGIAYIPYEAADSIMMNPDFIPPEKYNNKTISPEEIGILGQLRIVTQFGMPLRECGDGRMIADIHITSRDPIIGLKLENHSGIKFTYIDPEVPTNDNVHGRVGAIGASAWIGALNINPERSAIVSIYINRPGLEDMVDMYEKCNDVCLPDCYEDVEECVDKGCQDSCETELKKTKKELDDTKEAKEAAEIAENTAKGDAADAKAKDADADDQVEYVVYPDEVITQAGVLSKAASAKAKIDALQDTYGDKIITPNKWKELYPTREADIGNFVGKEDGSVQPEE